MLGDQSRSDLSDIQPSQNIVQCRFMMGTWGKDLEDGPLWPRFHRQQTTIQHECQAVTHKERPYLTVLIHLPAKMKYGTKPFFYWGRRTWAEAHINSSAKNTWTRRHSINEAHQALSNKLSPAEAGKELGDGPLRPRCDCKQQATRQVCQVAGSWLSTGHLHQAKRSHYV